MKRDPATSWQLWDPCGYYRVYVAVIVEVRYNAMKIRIQGQLVGV